MTCAYHSGWASGDARRMINMDRVVAGRVFGAVESAAVVTSALLHWLGSSAAHQLPLDGIIRARIDDGPPDFLTSLATAVLVVGLVGALGAGLQSRTALALAVVLGTGMAGLWFMMRLIDGVAAGNVGTGYLVFLGGLVAFALGVAAIRAPREIEASLTVFNGDPPQ